MSSTFFDLKYLDCFKAFYFNAAKSAVYTENLYGCLEVVIKAEFVMLHTEIGILISLKFMLE